MLEVAKLARKLMLGNTRLFFHQATTVTTKPEPGVPGSLTIPEDTLVSIKHNPRGPHEVTLIMNGASITLPIGFPMILELAKAAAFTTDAETISDELPLIGTLLTPNAAHHYELPHADG